MSFSVTGNLLRGSIQRPDAAILATLDNDQVKTYNTLSRWNRYGYVPVLSTITGFARTLLATIHTIAHAALATLSKNRAHHLNEASLGLKNIVRGCVEMVPLIGNTAVYLFDQKRINLTKKFAEDQLISHPKLYREHVAVFYGSQELGRCSFDDFRKALN